MVLLPAARRLGIEGHYFAFAATRTVTLLALEIRDLATAAELNERVLGTLVSGRPIFDYLTQLDRAESGLPTEISRRPWPRCRRRVRRSKANAPSFWLKQTSSRPGSVSGWATGPVRRGPPSGCRVTVAR